MLDFSYAYTEEADQLPPHYRIYLIEHLGSDAYLHLCSVCLKAVHEVMVALDPDEVGFKAKYREARIEAEVWVRGGR